MSELQDMLRAQARLHRKQGANALGDLFDNASKEIEQLKQRCAELERANLELATNVDACCDLVNMDMGEAIDRLFGIDNTESAELLNKFAIEQQIKGIENAYAHAPSKTKYRLPLMDSTDLFDYVEQLRKEQSDD